MTVREAIRKILAGAGVAATAAAIAVAPGATGADEAAAHHNSGQAIRHHANSVVSILNYTNNLGQWRGLSRGYQTCCFSAPKVAVGPAHDAIVTFGERRQLIRLAATGNHTLPRLNNPGHIIVKIVPNGGA